MKVHDNIDDARKDGQTETHAQQVNNNWNANAFMVCCWMDVYLSTTLI